MAHPLIPQLTELAVPIATSLGLEFVEAHVYTNHYPLVLRVDVRNPQSDTSLDDCERMSRALEAALDTTDIVSDVYVLEVSSPGVTDMLTTERDFTSFKGFAVKVTASQIYSGRQEWTGQLMGRDDAAVHLNRKGRAIAIPRNLVTQVQLIQGNS